MNLLAYYMIDYGPAFQYMYKSVKKHEVLHGRTNDLRCVWIRQRHKVFMEVVNLHDRNNEE